MLVCVCVVNIAGSSRQNVELRICAKTSNERESCTRIAKRCTNNESVVQHINLSGFLFGLDARIYDLCSTFDHCSHVAASYVRNTQYVEPHKHGETVYISDSIRPNIVSPKHGEFRTRNKSLRWFVHAQTERYSSARLRRPHRYYRRRTRAYAQTNRISRERARLCRGIVGVCAHAIELSHALSFVLFALRS